MQTKQRVILVVLLLLSLVQQGVRWRLGSGGINVSIAEPRVAAAAQAKPAEVPADDAERHCPLVHVNTAGMAELQSLPGIGPVLAERIIIARREKVFLEIRDLLRVSGIGEKRLAQIADLICLYIPRDAEAE